MCVISIGTHGRPVREWLTEVQGIRVSSCQMIMSGETGKPRGLHFSFEREPREALRDLEVRVHGSLYTRPWRRQSHGQAMKSEDLGSQETGGLTTVMEVGMATMTTSTGGQVTSPLHSMFKVESPAPVFFVVKPI